MMRATTPVKPTREHSESAARISNRVERLLGPDERQKQAWANFVQTNLAPDGQWNMPLLVDAARHEFLDTNQQRVFCAFPVKSGTTAKFSKYEGPNQTPKSVETRMKEEYPPLFKGSYTAHHSNDQRAPLASGYECDKYKQLMQTMLEAHLDIDNNTLVPEDVKEYGGTTNAPLSWKFKWLDGGIVFSIECLEDLHSIEGERKGNDRHFDFYALWTIRANTIRSD
jgi:hypothetical protein